jgi:predicted RNase H-like nuclease (RuvC/YqgF family)
MKTAKGEIVKNKRLRRLVDFASCRLHYSFDHPETCEAFIQNYIGLLKNKAEKYAKECRELQEEVDAGFTRIEELEEENRKLHTAIEIHEKFLTATEIHERSLNIAFFKRH